MVGITIIEVCVKKIDLLDIQLFIFQKKWQGLIYGTALAVSIACGTWLQTLVCFFAFNFIRPAFPKTFHHDNFYYCAMYSISMFVSSAISLLLFPIGLTRFGGIFVAFICCYILYFIQNLYEYICDNRALKEQLQKPKLFTLDTCNEAELVERCQVLHLGEENTQLAIEFFITKTKQSILADKYCIEEKSITTRKKRLKDKLEMLKK